MSGKSDRIHLQKLNLSKNIPNQSPPSIGDNIVVSFKYFDGLDLRFNFGAFENGFVREFFGRTQAICSMSRRDFVSYDRKGSLRIHKIDWSKSAFPDGFTCLNEQLQQHTAFQYEVQSRCRVYGFLIENIFYIVWVDPEHQAFPSKKR